MNDTKKLNILITGCSPGGMGAALAIYFHEQGHNVYATARSVEKLSTLRSRGLKVLPLDISSLASIDAAVASVTADLPAGCGLDMLVNNAASSYSMPMSDVSITEAKALFDINVWAQLAVSQAFLPLLLQSAEAVATTPPSSICRSSAVFEPMIVNHTSVGSTTAIPFQGIYNSSKAALAMMTDTMRLELAPFGLRVIDLKTAGVQTNIRDNSNVNARGDTLPADSIYQLARETVQKAMSQEELGGKGITAEQWASDVGKILLQSNPPPAIWKGESAFTARMASMLPSASFEGMIKKMTKLDVVEAQVKAQRAAR